MSMNWGEKPKRRIVVQAESETEEKMLNDFAGKVARLGRTQKWYIMSWIAAFLAAKESEE